METQAEIARLHLEFADCREAADHLLTSYLDLQKQHEALKTEQKDQRLLSEEDIQLLTLAIAECALRRPGFEYALNNLAKQLGGQHAIDLVGEFRRIHVDDVKPIG